MTKQEEIREGIKEENPYEDEVKAILSRGGYRGSLATEHLERESKVFNEGAEAQLKKIYEWGEEDCPHAGYVLDQPLLYKRECWTCWDTLKKEVE